MDLTSCGKNCGQSHTVTNLFLTGPPGAGKTTLLFSALKTCLPREGDGPGGFVVKKVYRAGRRVAMDLVDLGTGRRATLVRFPAGDRPKLSPEAFTSIGVPAIRQALEESRVVVMDELGRFEQGSPAFLATVRDALDSPVPVVGVLKAESNPFLDSVRARPDTAVIELGPAAEAQFRAALASLLRVGPGPVT